MSLETQCTAKRRGVAVLGSSGSIGVQTLDVIKQHSDKLFCAALAVGTRVEVLEAQARAFGVHSVALGSAALENDARCDSLRAWAHGFFGCGQDAVLELIHRDDVDIVVNSLVGSAGLRISYETLRAGKVLALANKESLVVGGDIIMPLAHELDARAGMQQYLMPIDTMIRVSMGALGDRNSAKQLAIRTITTHVLLIFYYRYQKMYLSLNVHHPVLLHSV